jgi:hypothetical protein
MSTAGLSARDIQRQAYHDASVCGACGRAMGAREPVWIARGPVGKDRGRGFGPPQCGACFRRRSRRRRVKRHDRALDCRRRGFFWAPCAGCGRRVCRATDGRTRQDFVCSAVCRRRLHAALAAEKRKHRRAIRPPRGVRCPACGRDFVPARSDARTCSPACRQKAYRDRRRVTDSA